MRRSLQALRMDYSDVLYDRRRDLQFFKRRFAEGTLAVTQPAQSLVERLLRIARVFEGRLPRSVCWQVLHRHIPRFKTLTVHRPFSAVWLRKPRKRE